MKRRTLTLTLCILACIALIGVGFASWVITYNKDAEVTGNVTVDEISDKRHIVTATISTASIQFGATAVPSDINDPWLTVPTAASNLVITFDVTITNSNLDDLESTPIEVSLEEKEVTIGTNEKQTPYAAAVDENYVIALDKVKVDIVKKNGAEEPSESNNYTATYTVTITFDWGTKFALDGDNKPSATGTPKNPTEFYNRQTYSDILANNALSTLQSTEYKNLAYAQFIITVSANTKSN